MELLNNEDMVGLIDKAKISMGETRGTASELFVTWGFDPDAIAETVVKLVKAAGEYSELPYDERYASVMIESTLISFVLGCLATIEVETRKQMNNETN